MVIVRSVGTNFNSTETIMSNDGNRIIRGKQDYNTVP